MVVASKHERGVVVRNGGVVVGENLAYPSRIHAAGVCLAFVCQSAGAAIKWMVVAKKNPPSCNQTRGVSSHRNGSDVTRRYYPNSLIWNLNFLNRWKYTIE